MTGDVTITNCIAVTTGAVGGSVTVIDGADIVVGNITEDLAITTGDVVAGTVGGDLEITAGTLTVGAVTGDFVVAGTYVAITTTAAFADGKIDITALSCSTDTVAINGVTLATPSGLETIAVASGGGTTSVTITAVNTSKSAAQEARKWM